jgi:hypothetical protein
MENESKATSSDSRYFTLKMNRSSYHEFERIRTLLSEQKNKIVTKVNLLDYLLELAKNNQSAI